MSNFKDSELALAGFLLQIKAIKIDVAHPFTWASGLKSPIYCDNRITLSHPMIRTFIRQEFVNSILEKFEKPDIIVGVATGGIAQGALVAEALGLPFAYVRPEAKTHGLGNKIEGIVEDGQSAIVIEDLISTGGSSLKAVEALREKGVIVKGLTAIFTYGLPIADEKFKKTNCHLQALTNFDSLLFKASEDNYIAKSDLESLMRWRMDPQAWGAERK